MLLERKWQVRFSLACIIIYIIEVCPKFKQLKVPLACTQTRIKVSVNKSFWNQRHSIYQQSKNGFTQATSPPTHTKSGVKIPTVWIIFIAVSTKILSSTAVFNLDNSKKCFLSSKSGYYNDFWRITEDWSNDAENSDLHHRNKLLLESLSSKQLF